MARTYHVKRAQQRYETRPVLDPATGEPKRSPKMKNGVQMKSKSGRLVFMTVTERDLTRPKPMPKCSKCGVVIEVGQPYKYTETYNRTIIRCGTCPTPQPWEYSSSLSARTAQIQHEGSDLIQGAESPEDLESARDEISSMIRELAEEKQEAAQNMEDGFGHETYQSAEIREQGEQLEVWADEIESVTLPDQPEPEEQECSACNGTGKIDEDGEDDCPECEGTATETPEEPTEDQIAEWLDEARQLLEDALGACPV